MSERPRALRCERRGRQRFPLGPQGAEKALERRGGHGHGHGQPHQKLVYILYAKRGERAHLQKRAKRTRGIPAMCMRWALIEMYLRSKSPIQTDRGVRSYGSDKAGVGTCPAGHALW